MRWIRCAQRLRDCWCRAAKSVEGAESMCVLSVEVRIGGRRARASGGQARKHSMCKWLARRLVHVAFWTTRNCDDSHSSPKVGPVKCLFLSAQYTQRTIHEGELR